MLDDQFFYFPEPWENRDWRTTSGLPLEDVWLTTADGTRVFGWYLQAAQGEPAIDAVMLWYHGNAGNLIHRLDNMARLHQRGVSLFIIDYRGYGSSKGRPSEPGLYADGMAAYDYLRKERGVPSEKIIIFGRSLGAAVAAEVAANREVAGVILETPFPSVESVARKLYGGLPTHQLLRARFNLMERLPKIRKPILVLHGNQDAVIPYELGKEVYEAAAEPKTFYRIDGADHNDTYIAGGEAYFEVLLKFMRQVTEGTP